MLRTSRGLAAVAAHTARAAPSGRGGSTAQVAVVGQLLVVDLEVRRRRLLVAGRELARAQVARRSADLQVELLLQLGVGLRVAFHGRLPRARAAVATLGEALRPALGLALLG